jgi:hypothetical protein
MLGGWVPEADDELRREQLRLAPETRITIVPPAIPTDVLPVTAINARGHSLAAGAVCGELTVEVT